MKFKSQKKPTVLTVGFFVFGTKIPNFNDQKGVKAPTSQIENRVNSNFTVPFNSVQ